MEYENAISGTSIPSDDLQVEKARALAQYLEAGSHDYAHIVDIVSLNGKGLGVEAIILDVDVERGQRVVHDIRHRERVATVFGAVDTDAPTVWALRPDFPRDVSHLYLYESRLPPSLCVYEEPWDEVRLHWTPMRFVERIRVWFARTAAGILHAGDQPLPPFLLGTYAPLIMPIDLVAETDSQEPYYFSVRKEDGGLGREVYIVEPVDPDKANQEGNEHLATVFRGSPQEQRSLQWRPGSLAELHGFAQHAGLDLLSELRTRLRKWHTNGRIGDFLDLRLMIILLLPRLRAANEFESEPPDIWAFATTARIKDVGNGIDAWQLHGDQIGQPLVIDDSKHGQDVELEPLRPHLALEPFLASLYSGIEPSDEPGVAAVGMGALGSQVFTNLLRMGWGNWTLIDEDYVLPHNFVRHALCGSALGRPKVDQLVALAHDTFPYSDQVNGIVANVLNPGDQRERLIDAFQDSDIILDMSASVPVARSLARDTESNARRISLFLNPSGSDLVLLAEDGMRSMTLDSLEMQYYRGLVTDPRLKWHLHREVGPIRYAQSCRDVSAVLGQERVGLHAANGSRAVRDVTSSEAAQGSIWRSQEDGSVERIEIKLYQRVEIECSPWQIITDEGLLAKVAQTRADRLPEETGGVLLGAFDLERKIVYVTDTIPSPPDSVEWPTVYIRGVYGLREQIEEARRITDRMLEYVGEWHSHPGASCQSSDDDRDAFAWLAREMDREGLPALMLIVSEDDYGWHLGQMR